MNHHQSPDVIVQIQGIDGLQQRDKDGLEGQIGCRHQGNEKHIVEAELPLAQCVGTDGTQKHRPGSTQQGDNQGCQQGYAQLLHGAGVALQRPGGRRGDGGGGHHLTVGLKGGHDGSPEGQHIKDQKGCHNGIVHDVQHRGVPPGFNPHRLRLLGSLGAFNAHIIRHNQDLLFVQ